MKTVFEYSDKNTLVIPQSLHSMSDVTSLLHHNDSGIFYKDLAHDLVDVEFYTNMPCVVYIQSGRETITTSDNKTHELMAHDALFLPQGVNLHSDYVKTTSHLKAYLIFFESEVIKDFLSSAKTLPIEMGSDSSLLTIKCDELMDVYFHSIHLLHQHQCNSAAVVRLKLLELLHLLVLYEKDVVGLLAHSHKTTRLPKRNLIRLLNTTEVLTLSVSDLANLSGRSISSFNRDFKAAYNMPPKQWLQNKRMAYAYQRLSETNLTVTHIASDLGYDNVSHFIKSFKEKYQITPKQLKQTP